MQILLQLDKVSIVINTFVKFNSLDLYEKKGWFSLDKSHIDTTSITRCLSLLLISEFHAELCHLFSSIITRELRIFREKLML